MFYIYDYTNMANITDTPITSIKWKANWDIFNTVTYTLYEDKVVCSSNHNGEKVQQTLPLATLHTITSITWVNRLKIIWYTLLILCYWIWLIFLLVYLCRGKNMITLNDRVALRYRDKEEWKNFLEAVLKQQNKITKK